MARACSASARDRLLLQSQGDAVQLRLQTVADVLRDLGACRDSRLPDDEAIIAPLDPLGDGASGAHRRPSALAAAARGQRPAPPPRCCRPQPADRLRDVVGFEIDRQTPFYRR